MEINYYWSGIGNKYCKVRNWPILYIILSKFNEISHSWVIHVLNHLFMYLWSCDYDDKNFWFSRFPQNIDIPNMLSWDCVFFSNFTFQRFRKEINWRTVIEIDGFRMCFKLSLLSFLKLELFFHFLVLFLIFFSPLLLIAYIYQFLLFWVPYI